MRIAGLGLTELLLILLVVLLIFGASRLPGSGFGPGKGYPARFKSSVTGEDEKPTTDRSASSEEQRS